MRWFGVRSVYLFEGRLDGADAYEERIVLICADDAETAISRAAVESSGYLDDLGEGQVLPLWQCFELIDDPGDGAEVFSLVRGSDLQPLAYIESYFDTGRECQISD